MSKNEAFNHPEPQADSSDDEIRPETDSSSFVVDGSFFTLSNRLEEVDIFVSASRKYIDAAKRTINELKNFITHVETDLGTADECVKETESRMQVLRQEVCIMKKKLQALLKPSVREMFENSVSSGRRDMYFYGSKSLQEYDENVKSNPEDTKKILEGPDDFAARNSRLQRHTCSDNLMLKNAEVLCENRYGCKFSRSCSDYRNTEEKFIPSGSRIFTSQNLSHVEGHSRTAFAGGESELRNYSENTYDNGSDSSEAASNSIGIEICSCFGKMHAIDSNIATFINDQIIYLNDTSEIGLPNHTLSSKEGYVESNKVQPSKEIHENSRTKKHSERHSTDYSAKNSLLGRQRHSKKKKSCENILSKINKRIEEIYEQSSSDSSDDLMPLLKERKDGIQDCNSEVLSYEVCRRMTDASRETASSRLAEEIRPRNEIIPEFLNNYQRAVPVNQPKSVYTSQKSLTADFDGEILVHKTNVRVHPASSKEGRSLRKRDRLSARDLDTKLRDLNAKARKPKTFLNNACCLSNSGEVKNTSHATDQNYRDIDYHSQNVSTPNVIHKNKSTNTDPSFNGTLSIDACVSRAKECVNQQDEPRASEHFTCGSVSNSTRNENDEPNKKNSGDSSANFFEYPSYVSFYEDVFYPTFLRCRDVSGCDGNSKCSATEFFNVLDEDPVMFEKKRSLSNSDNGADSALFLSTLNTSSVECECQTSPKSDDLRNVKKSSTKK